MRGLLLSTIFFLAVCGCNNRDRSSEISSENDMDAARNFIRAALDGRWNDARRLMLQDSTNLQVLDRAENNYQNRMSSEDKRGYREANPTFYDSRNIGDSITIINYSNSYKKKTDSLKLVRSNGQWLVDLKYSFPQTDTSHYVH